MLTRVADLIDPSTEQWDVQLVNDMFGPVDAQHILSIPLCDGMEDQLAWHFDNRGNFSVKSAYQLGVRIRDSLHHRDATTSASSTVVSFRWNRIWALQLPAKVRIFMWRLAHDSLPTLMNIKRKHVELDTLCPVCARRPYFSSLQICEESLAAAEHGGD